MRTHDLHGLRVKEAEAFFYRLLGEVRSAGKLEEVLFITGVGRIQDRLKELATEQELRHYVQLGNSGCLVVEFE